jgi:pyruvate-formate lyase-activating enzyme
MNEKNIIMKINQLSTGFIEVPNQISLNIYVQGCTKRCPECQNPELQSFNGGQDLNLKDVDFLLSDFPLCNWICWLGGDAYYQRVAMNEFNKKFKNMNLKTCLYTGVLFDTLNKDVLENLDLVVDGEWMGVPVADENSNQKIWIKDFESKWSIISWKDLKITFT